MKEGGSITKEINGKEHVFHRAYTPSRWTFVIDNKGIITSIKTEVNSSEDAKNVLNFLKSRKSSM